jgi:prepilin-type N-terminal cleavage/methylation domain-containing protein
MRRQKGFTLVELMVVITILGILIALAVTNMGPVKERAKEARVMAGMDEIVRALELYYQDHQAYPGVAFPECDDDTVSPFFDNSGDPDLWTMRGVIGGGHVPHDSTVQPYLDGFYFELPPATGFARSLPDRLMDSGALEGYPSNPFKRNVKGLTNQEIPMLNIFGIEFETDITALSDEPLAFHLSYPFVYNVADPGDYNFPSPADFGGINDFNSWYLGDSRGTVWGAVQDDDPLVADYAVTAGELQKYFPEGDFAYIPLDPVQTDPSNEQFMRSCKNYWIIVYGSNRSAQKNKYEGVIPHFPRPLGDGLYDPNDMAGTMTDFEWCVKAALTGAMHVYGTAYTDQFNIAGND